MAIRQVEEARLTQITTIKRLAQGHRSYHSAGVRDSVAIHFSFLHGLCKRLVLPDGRCCFSHLVERHASFRPTMSTRNHLEIGCRPESTTCAKRHPGVLATFERHILQEAVKKDETMGALSTAVQAPFWLAFATCDPADPALACQVRPRLRPCRPLHWQARAAKGRLGLHAPSLGLT